MKKNIIITGLFGVVLLGVVFFTNCAKTGDTVTIVVDSTVPTVDSTVPTVDSTSPVNNATEVPIDTVITTTFSETMDAASVATAFTIGGVVGSVSSSSRVATFTPTSNLAFATTYTATISAAAKDIPGNALASAYTWNFTTVSHGSLDTSFNLTGYASNVIGGSGDYARAMAIQTDGKIVIAGYAQTGINYDFAVVRYNTNGTLDTTFSTDGKVTAPIGSYGDFGHAMAIQSDGKIVVAGEVSIATIYGTNEDFGLARFNTDGSLDTSFGAAGKVTTAIGTAKDWAYAVAIQADGKIVAAGYSFNGTNNDIAVVRYNTNGTLDTTFDSDGKVTTAIGTGNDLGRAIAIQADQKIIVAGIASTASLPDFVLVRYNTNGSLDTIFNGTGKVTTDFSAGSDQALALTIQADQKIIAAGYTGGVIHDFALARYNTNGSLDTTFNGTGKVTTVVDVSDDNAYAVSIQADGKILAAGESYNGIDSDYALVRYNSNGSLDTTFDSDGILTKTINNSHEGFTGVATQADGKIVGAGYISTGTNLDFVVMRFWP